MMRVWVCLSDVCLSRSSGLSREQRPRKTKIGTEVGHVTRDSDTTFKVTRSKVNLQGAGTYCGGLPHSLFHNGHSLKQLNNSNYLWRKPIKRTHIHTVNILNSTITHAIVRTRKYAWTWKKLICNKKLKLYFCTCIDVILNNCAWCRHNMPQPPASWPLTFWPWSGVRVTCDVRYLCANFSLPRSLVLHLGPIHATDRQTSDRQSSDAHHRLMPHTLGAGHNKLVCTVYAESPKTSLHKSSFWTKINGNYKPRVCNFPINLYVGDRLFS